MYNVYWRWAGDRHDYRNEFSEEAMKTALSEQELEQRFQERIDQNKKLNRTGMPDAYRKNLIRQISNTPIPEVIGNATRR